MTKRTVAAMTNARGVQIRDYSEADEGNWLRCRVLGFLDTSYYDDVVVAKPRYDDGFQLVSVSGERIVGICDVSIAGESGTIETIVVHPDHRRQGIAHGLLTTASERLRRTGRSRMDAWTREDAGPLAWYRAEGFVPVFRYLHVYASTPEEMTRSGRTDGRLMPRSGHFHACAENEEDLRATYARVYGCNQLRKLL